MNVCRERSTNNKTNVVLLLITLNNGNGVDAATRECCLLASFFAITEEVIRLAVNNWVGIYISFTIYLNTIVHLLISFDIVKTTSLSFCSQFK